MIRRQTVFEASVRLLVIPVTVGMLSALTSCQAHSSASGSLSANGSIGATATGSASAKGSGSVTAQADGKAAVRLSDHITLVDDKLEYEGDINFKYDASTLEGSETFATLGHIRDILKAHPEVKIHIEGRADSRGDDDYNLRLSGARARAIAHWFNENGIAAGRVTSKGYGADKTREPERCRDKTGPDASFKGDLECLGAWSKNRRTVLVVTEGLTMLRRSSGSAPDREPPSGSVDLCDVRIGGRLSLLGPAVHGSLAFAIQPVCFLELNLGLGVKGRAAYAFGGEQSVRQDQTAVALMARGTFWFLPTHSPVLNLTLGASHYEDNTWLGFGAIGAGYGYRSAGPFRLTVLVGALLPFSSDMGALPSAFGELSLGLLW